MIRELSTGKKQVNTQLEKLFRMVVQTLSISNITCLKKKETSGIPTTRHGTGHSKEMTAVLT